jgi:NAD(P)-dependent dehydrogenase (short-subunit alcohol dehydrogenase family)
MSDTTSTPRIALITGGSRGLGRNAAQHLAHAGIDVVLTYHSNRDAAEATVAEIEALGRKAAALQLDAGDVASFPAFADALKATLGEVWGRETFDILVNNAGFGLYKPFAETTEADFDSLMNVHFKGVFFLTQGLLPLLADGARIVNISSGLARFSMPGSSAYGSMKGAIETLTRYMARELAPRGITANALAPGAIETDFGGGRVRDNPEINKMVAAQTALGRVGLPDDVGGALAALVSEGTNWVTGQRIEVSGGMLL